MKYAVIGAGMSGLAIAHILQDAGHEVTVLEKDSRPGGMIKCDRLEGGLFHRTGGHVFNTKRGDVMDWFWTHFDKEKEFTKADRNSSVVMEGMENVPYPIENHVYKFSEEIQKAFIDDLLGIASSQEAAPENFEEFLKGRFGNTLYELYFQPYNYKVWRRDLSQVPLSWLEGKLPMPTVSEMLYFNMNHIEEKQFVHSSFYYPKEGGSQFLADRLSEGLSISYGEEIKHVERNVDGCAPEYHIGERKFDRIIYCGNVKQLPQILSSSATIVPFIDGIESLESHGTTAVFCELDPNPYSWMYMPGRQHEAHRIICTGNFSPTNNPRGRMTGTVEFTDYIRQEDILDNLNRIPYVRHYIGHHYEKYTYPIQKADTRELISKLKFALEAEGIYLLGRFAEWEYYNMDVAIGAALDLYNKKLQCHG